jgi:hypothetical protein
MILERLAPKGNLIKKKKKKDDRHWFSPAFTTIRIAQSKM